DGPHLRACLRANLDAPSGCSAWVLMFASITTTDALAEPLFQAFLALLALLVTPPPSRQARNPRSRRPSLWVLEHGDPGHPFGADPKVGASHLDPPSADAQ